MVSSPDRDDLVFPKVLIANITNLSGSILCVIFVQFLPSHLLQGGWEDDESIEEAACREALEEAGVRGVLNVGSLYLLWILKSRNTARLHSDWFQ